MGQLQLNIQATDYTPEILFDLTKGDLSIIGRSIPDNTHTFYQPLFDALKEYSKNLKDQTNVTICMDYFNTGTSKYLYDMFEQLAKLESNVIVDWKFDEYDEDGLESGEDFRDLFEEIEFNFIKIKE